MFVLNPEVNWDTMKTKHNNWGRHLDQHLSRIRQDLARFVVFNSEPWAKHLERRLNAVLLHLWSDWTALQRELVLIE